MKLNPYLNFEGNAKEALTFYQSVFGGELTFLSMSESPDADKLPEHERDYALHVSIPIGDEQMIMASDCLKSRGDQLTKGNNNYISVAPDSREEAKRIFDALSQGGDVEMTLQDMFWGDYFGSFTDKFGVCWMINYS